MPEICPVNDRMNDQGESNSVGSAPSLGSSDVNLFEKALINENGAEERFTGGNVEGEYVPNLGLIPRNEDETTHNAGENTDTSDSSSSSSTSDENSSESESESESEAKLDAPLADEEGADNDDDWIPRTRNEILEQDILQLPESFEMKPDTAIEQAGSIVSVGYDGVIVVKAITSGKYRILSEGAVFCMADRDVLGVMCETFGPVEHPFYVIRRAPDSIDRQKFKAGEDVYYVVSTGQYVLTENFKSKGSDASNFHDEEVPIEEQEFSDDEQETLHRHSSKKKRKRKHPSQTTAASEDGERPSQRANLGPQASLAPNSNYRQLRPYQDKQSAQLPQMPRAESGPPGHTLQSGPPGPLGTLGPAVLPGPPGPPVQQGPIDTETQSRWATWFAYYQRFFGQSPAPPY